VLPGLAAAVLLTLAVLAGAAWARVSQATEPDLQSAAGPGPVASRHPAVPGGPDWRRVLEDLDAARAAAFANADVGTLALVDAPGSPAMERDRAAVRALAERRLQARGFRIELLDVQPVTVGTRSAVLSVSDRRDAYELVDRSGSVLAAQPARGSAHWRIELVLVDGTWLERDVT
jgi:hypothetical protein